MEVTAAWYMSLAAVLFLIGASGMLIRRNALMMFMSIELMLNSVNLTFVAAGRELGSLDGQLAVFFVLVVAAAELNLVKTELDQRWPRLSEVPFTSERKRMTTVHRVGVTPEQTDAPWSRGSHVAFAKGAVDSLLEISERVWAGDEDIPMSDEMRSRILAANDRLAGQGQRVLGVAFRPLDETTDLPGW